MIRDNVGIIKLNDGYQSMWTRRQLTNPSRISMIETSKVRDIRDFPSKNPCLCAEKAADVLIAPKV